jgi:mediator of RNA polymerase II transcription subunit 19
LGKTPAIVHSGPFYLMKEPPSESELTGSTNLMAHYSLEHSYNKFCGGRKQKDQLSAFLPTLPGNIDTPGSQDNSSLRLLIEKPPVGGKELLPLTQEQLVAFRLHPTGPLPKQYCLMSQQSVQKKKHKHKKNKGQKPGETPAHESQAENADAATAAAHEKKHKRNKKHDDEKERKKKKKEKKKKKQKHGPEGTGPGAGPSSAILGHGTGPT